MTLVVAAGICCSRGQRRNAVLLTATTATSLGARVGGMGRGSAAMSASRCSSFGRRTFFHWTRNPRGQPPPPPPPKGNSSSSWTTFPFADPGLRWTATVSHPADVPGVQDEEGKGTIPSRAEQLRNLQKYHRKQNDDKYRNPTGASSSSSSSDGCCYDVLVIGGGATGSGIALDAATRGLKVACIERGDFASETSSRSGKLIWAGLKYFGSAVAGMLSPSRVLFEKGPSASFHEFVHEMKMVRQCHEERHYMTTQNKHLCHWIPIVVPFRTWTLLDPHPPMGHVLLGLFPIVAPVVFKMYDALSGFHCPPSYIMTPSTTRKRFPQLDADSFKYCAVFYEAQHNDARTNVAIALTAAKKGAHIVNYVAALSLTKDADTGRVNGANVVDRMTNKHFHIPAKNVVFAGGPFTDQLRQLEYKLAGPTEEETTTRSSSTTTATTTALTAVNTTVAPIKPTVKGAHGTHVVLSGHLTPQGKGTAMGLLDCNTSDGRFLFVLPWLNHVLMGTTDVSTNAQAETLPKAPVSEVDWILKEAGKFFRQDLQPEFTRTKVTSAWRGWRPLAMDTDQAHVRQPRGQHQSQVSRSHVISQQPETGCWFIVGGKWTTWREMAQELVDHLTPTKSKTLTIQLLGAVGYTDDLPKQVQAKYPYLEDDICQHLVDTYGGRVWDVCELPGLRCRLVQGFPYVEAEVPYACREYAVTIEDILSRRTRLAYLDHTAAVQALPRVADLLQKELKWTNQVKREQIVAAQQYIQSYDCPIGDT